MVDVFFCELRHDARRLFFHILFLLIIEGVDKSHMVQDQENPTDCNCLETSWQCRMNTLSAQTTDTAVFLLHFFFNRTKQQIIYKQKPRSRLSVYKYGTFNVQKRSPMNMTRPYSCTFCWKKQSKGLHGINTSIWVVTCFKIG